GVPVQSLMTPRLRSWYRAVTGRRREESGGARSVRVEDVLAPISCPIFHLEGFPDVPVLQPGLEFYLERLKRREGFAFVKRTHGFWDALVFISKSAPDIGARVARGEPVKHAVVRAAINDPGVLKSLEERALVGVSCGANFKNHFNDHFYTELIEDLQSPLEL